jgi:hypothetical protein
MLIAAILQQARYKFIKADCDSAWPFPLRGVCYNTKSVGQVPPWVCGIGVYIKDFQRREQDEWL